VVGEFGHDDGARKCPVSCVVVAITSYKPTASRPEQPARYHMAQSRHVPTIEDLYAKRDEIHHVVRALGADNIQVFGSVARNEADAKSDYDFLVDIVADVHGFDYFGLLEDLRRSLSELLGRDVHVVGSASLLRIKERVLQDAIPL
jgi:uncharacterized protein